jgi:isopentenyl diphosphate isomerase/L-lactate dehydrogenase-like FMN-dependent dehydrogenase
VASRLHRLDPEPNLTLTDLESLAAARLDPDWREFFQCGAATETTLHENCAAFRRLRFRQRVLCGIDRVDTSTTILGHVVAHPVVVAPLAYQQMAHPDGEGATARGAAATGGALCLSTFSTVSATDVAAAAPDALLFHQVYVFRDRGVTDELIAQAVGLGYKAVFLTVDLPVAGSRDRERRINWTFPDRALPAVRYAIDRGVPDEGNEMVERALDWAYLERLVSTAGVPVVVKGILDEEDARRAVSCGAAGIVVSNHGGRQLDPTEATIEALPRIVEAVGGRLEVLLDSGIRRGSDVVAALARGAQGVLAGRVPLWGLAIGGAEGVREALELLREETAVTMHLTGCATIADVGPHCLLG